MKAIVWALAVTTFWLTFLAGWIMNVVAVINSDFTTLTGVLIVRLAGIFIAPLGAVMGLFV